MNLRVFAVIASLGVQGVLSGCAALQHQAHYEQMYEYTYPRPLDELWPEVRKFVSEQGYPPMESPRQYVMISDWVTSFNESRVISSVDRIFVRGLPLNRANSEIRIYRESRMTGSKLQLTPTDMTDGSVLMFLAADEVSPLGEDPIHHSHKMKDGSAMGINQGNKSKDRGFARAVDLEWKLLQRLDAAEARRIEEQVAQQKH
ncbi:hypothetical protein F0U60_25210 [Archangium minus]|uniref:Lipoprotein n=1 Tax=Archangium minus TaxID=83450 RepID=A0ABY9WVH7_9BACT|nr:hypothetical protein F0U60_25210 [Archangium minus]